ncbi:MAG: FecR family protein [Balneolaceae bacterium]|nr:FecR family protein [Balneolaceae bacterium]
MTTQLSNNDSDRRLAKQLGKALEDKVDWESNDDSLVQELAAFRQNKIQKTVNERANTAALWNRIDQQINADSSSSTNIFSMNATRWAAAALLLIASLVGAYYYQFLRGPTLIADSGSSRAAIQLADGSHATLRPHTKLYQITESEERLSYRLTGEAYFEVTPDPARKFQVEAGNGNVTVLGPNLLSAAGATLHGSSLKRDRCSSPANQQPILWSLNPVRLPLSIQIVLNPNWSMIRRMSSPTGFKMSSFLRQAVQRIAF